MRVSEATMSMDGKRFSGGTAYGMVFDHLGLAVRVPDSAKRFLVQMGYELGDVINDPLQMVNLIMCRSSSMPDIEIVYPANEGGPLDQIFRTGREGLYHICYRSEDVGLSVKLMKEDGLTVVCVAAKKPAVLFGGAIVSFYLVAGFGLVEILERRTMER